MMSYSACSSYATYAQIGRAGMYWGRLSLCSLAASDNEIIVEVNGDVALEQYY